MFIPNKSNVKFANGTTVNDQAIEIILCCFPNCTIIYPVVPVYLCPGHPSNTISLDALKCYVGFKNDTFEPPENCDFVEFQDYS